MAVGIVRIDLSFDYVRSLKEKRSILEPLLARLRTENNVSVNELEGQNDPQHSTVGIAYIANDGKACNRKLSKIAESIENSRNFRVNNYSLEVF